MKRGDEVLVAMANGALRAGWVDCITVHNNFVVFDGPPDEERVQAGLVALCHIGDEHVRWVRGHDLNSCDAQLLQVTTALEIRS